MYAVRNDAAYADYSLRLLQPECVMICLPSQYFFSRGPHHTSCPRSVSVQKEIDLHPTLAPESKHCSHTSFVAAVACPSGHGRPPHALVSLPSAYFWQQPRPIAVVTPVRWSGPSSSHPSPASPHHGYPVNSGQNLVVAQSVLSPRSKQASHKLVTFCAGSWGYVSGLSCTSGHSFFPVHCLATVSLMYCWQQASVVDPGSVPSPVSHPVDGALPHQGSPVIPGQNFGVLQPSFFPSVMHFMQSAVSSFGFAPGCPAA